MTILQRLFPFIAFAAVICAAAGCSGKHEMVPGAPDWVNLGGGAVEDSGEKVFYGVGAVTGITSPSLRAQTADQRARADIARQLDTYVANLYRDYQRATPETMGRPAVEEEHVDQSLKAFTQVTVRGVRIIERWREPETDTLYSLARIDLDGIRATLSDIEAMDPSLRQYMRDNAEKAFSDIRREEQQRR
ncbi:MAG: hypothetical protein GWO11_04165 [Desulfuromonadales bacterium]|nr:hypothetical protein [Desulfuromonadales bacterium]NIR33623.1 hypothetical protein [Desulfuromonadales bacterium]NIS41243.1 hypothetical protein [Desulfuromonadales bacterium]